jgi:LPXTG-motif cell wall-anchored protein
VPETEAPKPTKPSKEGNYSGGNGSNPNINETIIDPVIVIDPTDDSNRSESNMSDENVLVEPAMKGLPKTGDSINVAFYATLMIASAFLALVTFRRFKKK